MIPTINRAKNQLFVRRNAISRALTLLIGGGALNAVGINIINKTMTEKSEFLLTKFRNSMLFFRNRHFSTKRAKTKRLHRVAQIEDDRGKEIFTIAERAKK